MKLRSVAAIAGVVLAAVAACVFGAVQGNLWQRASMECVARLQYPAAEVWVSRDLTHVAYRSYVEGVEGAERAKAREEDVDGTRGRFMVQDGRRHATYDMVGQAAFTPDGAHFVYTARRDGRAAVVMDGREFRWYAEIWGVSINPRTAQVAYTGRDEGRGVLVIDGVEQQHPYDVYEPVWSPNGQRLAYRVTTAGQWAVVVDGIMGDLYDEVTVLQARTFSPDSTMYAYGARSGEKWFCVVDGKPGPPYSRIRSGPTWGARGHRLAYLADRGAEGVVVIDGHEGAALSGYGLVLSPDGQRVAYAAGDWEEGSRAVVDGVSGPLYGSILPIVFSADGRHVAYTARESRPSGRPVLVVDGREEWVDARWVTFSPDGSHLAYVAHALDGDTLVIDGRARARHRGISGLQFSTDSQHVAYVGYATAAPASAYVPRVERTGGHAVIGITRGAKLSMFVDGRAGPEFSGVCLESDAFTGNGTVRYVAVRDDAVYAVQQTVPDRHWLDR